MTMRARGLPLGLLLVLACKGPNAKIERLRDGLADDDARDIREAGEALPTCKEPLTEPVEKGCFREIANAFGSKSGFNMKQIDQAAAATIALVVARDQHGDWAAAPDTWLASVRTGKGPGGDALRLAIAREMAAGAADVGKSVDDEKDARKLLKVIGGAIPGACATYAALGNGMKTEDFPVAAMPDHSPCIQKDLERADGPGGTYGRGTWRAAEGAVALWKDEARALHDGAEKMSGKPRATLEAKLGAIDAATAKLALKKVPREEGWLKDMAEVHGDAGVVLIDAGLSQRPPAPPAHPAVLGPMDPRAIPLGDAGR